MSDSMSVITAKKRKLLVAKKDILLIIMDPLAIAAVVGLVFAGKRLADGRSESPESGRKPLPATTKPLTRRDIDLMGNSRNHSKDYTDFMNTTPDVGRRVGDWRLQPKEAVPNLQDMTQTNGRFHLVSPFMTCTTASTSRTK